MNVAPSLAELVTLKGGVTVELQAIRFALDLEDRGIRMRVESDGTLVLNPASRVTKDDVTACRRHKSDLIRIATYEPPEVG